MIMLHRIELSFSSLSQLVTLIAIYGRIKKTYKCTEILHKYT